jgi:hypothetical protein
MAMLAFAAEFAVKVFFGDDDIVSLSQRDIRRMYPEDLVALIRLADVPLFRDRVNGHLPYLDRPTLERLAFLAQWTVQNQNH